MVYVVNNASNNVSVIDTSTHTVVATVPVGNLPRGVAVNPAGTRVYVVNNASFNVSVIDTSTDTVVSTVPVVSGPVAFGQFIGPYIAGVGGTVTGQTGIGTFCFNDTTGQQVLALMPDGESWDCEASGLLVSPGDAILMLSIGVAD
jgi:YVTN family beta-propeller protein